MTISRRLKEKSGSWYRNKCHIKPLPGFPWSEKFSQVEEIKRYFNEDKLLCLLCGRKFSKLANHISQGHEMPMDEYKERFGIPWTYGLAGKYNREKSAAFIKMRRMQGIIERAPSEEHIEKLRNAAIRKRPLVPAFQNDSRRKLLEFCHRKEKWNSEDYEEYLRRIRSGRTPAEVGRDNDMPSVQAFRRYVKENSDFRMRYEFIWKNLPYSVHIRASKLGESFQCDLVRLRGQKLKWSQIADLLGVTTTSVRSTWHKLKKLGKLGPGDLCP